ncbi:putative flagellar basal-body rod protein [Ligilactobacillus salitolerans]|uniref:Putative flagellar basal-body rod protein n=1 Tax=Ligilactobacillus salitolerans TaxID=1808352 RepID=A0A401ITS7_9LACO|nr:flagellar hook-basal body complex protein [Ligilactobacillus salitolerans]GBG94916.1 putative flagellar basal-body rod protein [Ligilactobacillus salitolerans]
MIRGIDTLRHSFNVLQAQQENLSSNIANVETPGYLQKNLFEATMDEVQLHNNQAGIKNETRHEVGGFTWGNQIDGSAIDTTKGALNPTGLPTDFALQGDGYFAVRLGNGQTAYTRNGHFSVDGNGQLVTQEGFQVLGQNAGPVRLGQGTPAFMLVSFPANTQLQNLGGTFYTGQGTQASNAIVRSGMLENSNVSASDQMVELMQTNRQFQAQQKVLNSTNSTLDKAVNQLGRI